MENYIVTRQRIARQGFDKHPARHTRNNRTEEVYNLLLDNGAGAIMAHPNNAQRSRDLRFLCGLCSATVELCFLRCPCCGYIKHKSPCS
jgi:hypothetical protein